MRAAFGTLALTGAFLALCSVVVHAQSDEEYKVYDAVIRSRFRQTTTRVDTTVKIDELLIRNRTESTYGRGSTEWPFVKDRLPELLEETITGYKSVEGKEVSLDRRLDLPLPYKLISDKEIKDFFDGVKRPIDLADLNKRWEEFYKKYPDSRGYNSLSRVGFNAKRTQALVYSVNLCGSLCGTGTYYLLVKEQGGWVVRNVAPWWVS